MGWWGNVDMFGRFFYRRVESVVVIWWSVIRIKLLKILFKVVFVNFRYSRFWLWFIICIVLWVLWGVIGYWWWEFYRFSLGVVDIVRYRIWYFSIFILRINWEIFFSCFNIGVFFGRRWYDVVFVFIVVIVGNIIWRYRFWRGGFVVSWGGFIIFVRKILYIVVLYRFWRCGFKISIWSVYIFWFWFNVIFVVFNYWRRFRCRWRFKVIFKVSINVIVYFIIFYFIGFFVFFFFK